MNVKIYTSFERCKEINTQKKRVVLFLQKSLVHYYINCLEEFQRPENKSNKSSTRLKWIINRELIKRDVSHIC